MMTKRLILLVCFQVIHVAALAQPEPFLHLPLDGNTETTEAIVQHSGVSQLHFASGISSLALDLTAASPSRFPVILEDSLLLFNAEQSFSVQAWVNTETAGTQAFVSNKNIAEGDSAGWALGIQPSGAWSWQASDGRRQFAYQPTAPRQAINDGKWHHIVFTIDREIDEARFYYDGINVGIYNIQGLGSFASGNPVAVGGSSGVEDLEWHSFTGYLDEAAFWRQALTAQDVSAMYAMHRPDFVPPATISVDTLNVMAWNIWHGGHEHGEIVGVDRVIELIKASGADLISMQETYGSGERIADALGYYFYLRSSNLSIMSRYPIGETIEVFKPFNSGGAHIQTGEKKSIVFFPIWLHYLPDYLKHVTQETRTSAELVLDEGATRHSEIIDILVEIAPLLAQEGVVIMAGDFNSGSHYDWTLEAASLHNGFTVEWPVSKEMAKAGFIDAYRHVHPDPLRFQGRTWSPGSSRVVQDRIDYIYVRGEGIEIIDASVIDTHKVKFPSDHAAVLTTLVLP